MPFSKTYKGRLKALLWFELRCSAAIPLLLVITLGLSGCRFLPGARTSTDAVIAVGEHCGTERWSVKTLSDPDAQRVDLISRPTTITALRSLHAPATLPDSHRVEPTELQTFIVHAQVMEYKLETDHDIHVVLIDDDGQTMIAEIPDTSCAGALGSPEMAQMKAARAAFIARFGEPEEDSSRATPPSPS